jgi:YD repeat-containing protein
MKRIAVSMIFMTMIPLLTFSQEQDYLPFYTPPSPDAYSLGKYGQIPVGMFTGTPNHNIPLYVYKTKNLSVPVSVSYLSNGIKVDEVESKVGLGWSLNSGGVITRIVRDLPDEESLSFFPSEEIEETGARGPLAVKFFHDAAYDENDTETDLFTYNFMGRFGKFVYNNKKGIVQMPESDLKIEPFYIDESSYGYNLTTADGVIYRFSDIEISRSYVSPSGHPEPEFVKTAWYLSKIVHPTGEEIIFTYDSEELLYTTSISQSVEVVYPKQQVGACGTTIFQPPDERSYQNVSRVFGKRIKEISSSIPEFGKVIFTPVPPSSNIGVSGNRLIGNMSVIDKDSNIIENIDFQYFYFENSKRFFLDRMVFLDTNRFFSFAYIEPDNLVERLSFQQDHWGFYNGATSNTCLVPKLNNDDAFGFLSFGANREPDWNYSKKGLLSKITYPTKGTSELIYEPNTFWGENITFPPRVESYLVTATNAEEGGNSNPVSDTIFSALNQTADVLVFVAFNSPPCDSSENIGKSKATFSIVDLTTNQQVELYNYSMTGIPVPLGTDVFSDNPPVTSCLADLKANTSYKLTLTPKFKCVRTSSTVRFYNQTPDTAYSNIQAGGSRISKIINNDPVTNKNEILRYYYGPKDSLTKSSGDPGQKAFYITSQKRIDHCLNSYTDYTVKILSSSSLTPMYNTGNNNIYYKYVTVSHGGDNFENGGAEYKYILHRDIVGNCLAGEEIKGAPWSNIGWDHGLENKITIFRIVENGSKIVLKMFENHYCTDERIYDEVKGYSVRKEYELEYPQPAFYICKEEDTSKIYTFNHCLTNHRHVYWLGGSDSYCINSGANNVVDTFPHPCFGLNQNDTITNPVAISNLDIMEYKNLSYWHYLDFSTITNFDQDGLNPVTKTARYLYDNADHLQLTCTEALNSTGDSTRIVTHYPQDVDSNLVIGMLIEQHRIAEIIKEEKFVKHPPSAWQKISTTEYHFKDWGNGIIQPYFYQSSVFNQPLETRERYYAVDTSTGNALEFAKENDIHISYIWGYQKTKPVIEGKNVCYNDLNTAVASTNFDFEQLLSPTGIGDLKSPIQRALWESFNNALRDQSLLSGAMVNTYTYKPMVGITSKTDQNGLTTYYEYDDFGRLMNARDSEYNIISSYNYHYHK